MKRSRKQLEIRIRLRGEPDSSSGYLIEWLNSKDPSIARELVLKALTMAYMPQAKFNAGCSDSKIRECFADIQDMWSQHNYCVKEDLNIRSEKSNQDSIIRAKIEAQKEEEPVKPKEEEQEAPVKPKRYKSAFFNDDEFD